MSGHLEKLVDTPLEYLNSPEEATDRTNVPYTDTSDFSCPVCGKKNLTYQLSWGSTGNQRIFACSEEHANLIYASPTTYFVSNSSSGNSSTNGFCTGSSVMSDGFRSSIGGTCVKLFFQSWILNSRVKYAFAFLGLIVAGMALELFNEKRESIRHFLLRRHGKIVLREQHRPFSLFETVFPRQQSPFVPMSRQTMETSHIIQVMPFSLRCALALMYVAAIAVAYFLMLVVMMYDTGLFFAVLVGLGLGYGCFREISGDSAPKNVDPCCST